MEEKKYVVQATKGNKSRQLEFTDQLSADELVCVSLFFCRRTAELLFESFRKMKRIFESDRTGHDMNGQGGVDEQTARLLLFRFPFVFF